ncbi:TPA: type VI secretion system ImpA family N-terminal domain-containing protein [Serratia rubidaea]|nr:type VI secretion system ImpA family N-terminal domain-containing protein [Serratia rubidaea]HDJ1449286.1 type VI secretion system ImpA family N-terminal domain-containing protein [Serratia rubidaea]HDJ1461238.1 type VI secretion system ImpA family N-terminal domain-containing protein [Serratia rubidaea]HDJ2773382.1 type VI secretion system ImpA family N-terminal domain-containing protein [Serratia rubidaea]
MANNKHLKIGGDPRALPDYAVLRDELLKLSHPARPDVEWRTVETLCLRLFEHNGVDLQTAAWYTLARGHLAGLTGIQEGLALVNALTAYQWSVMWPVSVHTRMEIIIGLNQRLQNVLRTLALDDRDELERLYQLEKSLKRLAETLARHELQQVSRTEGIQQRIRQAITRLENMPRDEGQQPAVALPPQAVVSHADEPTAAADRLVLVVPPEPTGERTATTPRAVRPFLAGACSALLAGGLLLWGWHSLNAPSAAQQRLTASLTPLPGALTREQLVALRQTQPQADALTEQTRQQLQWLMTLPPDWSLRYGQQLMDQAQVLWPDNPDVAAMQQAWRQHLEANALPATSLLGWRDGMQRLQQLTNRLNGLDEKHGKYMTVSELKSSVFAITQAFNRHPPAEERLRRYGAGTSEARRKQAEMALEQLQARYFLQHAASAEKMPDDAR